MTNWYDIEMNDNKLFTHDDGGSDAESEAENSVEVTWVGAYNVTHDISTAHGDEGSGTQHLGQPHTQQPSYLHHIQVGEPFVLQQALVPCGTQAFSPHSQMLIE